MLWLTGNEDKYFFPRKVPKMQRCQSIEDNINSLKVSGHRNHEDIIICILSFSASVSYALGKIPMSFY